MEVGCVIGLKMDVMWIVPKLMEYGKSHKWPWEFGRINYVSEWVYGAVWVIM